MRSTRIRILSPFGDPRGFSLVELLTASVILSTVLLAVGVIYPRGMSAIASSSDRSRASNLAQEKLEELFEAASSGHGLDRLREGTFEDQPIPRFLRTWSVSRDRIEPGLADLSVTVTWEHSRGRRSVTLKTLVTVKEVQG